MRQPVTRRYLSVAHYNADAAQMAAAGWRVASIQREPSGAIVAIYSHPSVQIASPALRSRHPWHRSTPGLFAIIGGAVVLLSLVIGALLAIATLESNFVTMPPQPFMDSAQATNQAFTTSLDAAATANAALATETPLPTRVSGPRLGAPLSDFDTAFGPEHSQGVWYVTLNGQSIMLTVQTNTMGAHNTITTPDGLDRVWTLSVDYLGPAPSNSQNAAICKQFMPSDALHISDNADSPTPEHIYRSQILAASFDLIAFQNNTGDDVAPGTFDVFYTARSCSMSTGQE